MPTTDQNVRFAGSANALIVSDDAFFIGIEVASAFPFGPYANGFLFMGTPQSFAMRAARPAGADAVAPFIVAR